MGEEKPSVTLPGTMQKAISPRHPGTTEKAQIRVEGAEEMYREIRIENELTDKNGEKVRLKEGAQVEVTVEATEEATTPGKPKNDT
jgi:predicted DNA-binding antitoxin AbrB/MazE fold protein